MAAAGGGFARGWRGAVLACCAVLLLLSGHSTVGESEPWQPQARERLYGFRRSPYPYGSRTLADIRGNLCPGDEEPDVAPIDPRLKVLLVIGAQKAGTTFLFWALNRHKAFRPALHGYRRDPEPFLKELHYFDAYPAPPGDFLTCFDPMLTQLNETVTREDLDYVLVDATPSYIRTPIAPARAKQLIPQARIVVVLRDPVARAYSGWKMHRQWICKQHACSGYGTFLTYVEDMLVERRQRHCLFDAEGGDKDWFDCTRCIHSKVLREACAADPTLESCPELVPPSQVGTGLYAAQIAHWLQFFPPERFLVVTSAELRDPDSRVQALNRILEHAEVAHNNEPFNRDLVVDVEGYNGEKTKVSDEEVIAMKVLAHSLNRTLEDLYHLLGSAGIHVPPIPSELPSEMVQSERR